MEVKLDLDGDKETTEFLTRFPQKQLPFAAMLALNRTAAEVKGTLVKVMESKFDRPTPWVLNSFVVRPATKRHLEAIVQSRLWAGKGTPAYKSLAAEASGGPRRMKSSEKRMGAFLVPSKFMKLNQYGNVTGPEYVRLLSQMGAFPETGYQANATNSRRSKNKRDVSKGGVEYVRLGDVILRRTSKRKIVPAFLLSRKAPSYKRVFPFNTIAHAVALRTLKAEFFKAAQDALATAKP